MQDGPVKSPILQALSAEEVFWDRNA